MHIQLFADELAEAAIPDILNVSRLISDVFARSTTAHFRPGMFREAVSRGKLDPDRFGAATLTIAVTGYDLQPAGLDYAFGVTRGVASLVSTARLEGSAPRFAVVALHEVGHMLGLVDQNCSNHDERHYFEGHCRNACIMQAVNSLVDVDRCVENLLKGIVLCGDCRAFLRTR
jgi:predicted Zn-dependent protease